MRISVPASKSLSSTAVSRLALRGVVAVALLLGAAQHIAFGHEIDAQKNGINSEIEKKLYKGDNAQAAAMGEAAVAQTPQSASLRAELGHAYLRAGRFEAAAAALRDAEALGDTTDRVTLSLALAQIACGQNRAALATLDRGAHIAPADLGLALALAGDPGRGIAVLTDAVRDGSGSVNLRQNLAYAYALDGRWADATLTAGFDLPPDQVNTRVQQWAQSMQSGGERLRIARLLNVPLTTDPGMPASLALNQVPSSAPVPVASAPTAVEELPSAAAVTATSRQTPAVAESIPVPSPSVAPPPPRVGFAALRQTRRLSVRMHAVSLARAHFVQLAAYHSRHSAELGRLILAKRHRLHGHGLMIAQATFHGRSYWRVIMAGFDGSSAANFCTSLKRQGAACFAYSGRSKAQGQSLAWADVSRNHSTRW